MGYYERHVFFCLNEREGGRSCCARGNAAAMHAHAKRRVKELGLAGAGKVRINQAGCLDRCRLGPCLVVYPEAVWYRYADERDIDEIVETHLIGGMVVERLRIADAAAAHPAP